MFSKYVVKKLALILHLISTFSYFCLITVVVVE